MRSTSCVIRDLSPAAGTCKIGTTSDPLNRNSLRVVGWSLLPMFVHLVNSDHQLGNG